MSFRLIIGGGIDRRPERPLVATTANRFRNFDQQPSDWLDDSGSSGVLEVIMWIACGVVLAVVGGWAVVRAFRTVSVVSALGLTAGFVGLGAGIPAIWSRSIWQESSEPADLRETSYQTSDSCKKCHPSHYASWHRTYHRTMTQPATAATVLGKFNTEVTLHGERCRLIEDDGRFFMNVLDPIWSEEQIAAGKDPRDSPTPQRRTFEIHGVVGSHHMQVYISRAADGMFQTLPLVWHISMNRWISRAGCFLTPAEADDPASFGQYYSEWNKSCIFCHNTRPSPGMIVDSEGEPFAWNPQMEEMGIACEACHGPAALHVAKNSNPVRRFYLNETQCDDRTLVNPAKLPKELSVEVCARCHAKWEAQTPLQGDWLQSGDFFVPGQGRLDEHYYRPYAQPGGEFFEARYADYWWPDQTPRPTGMEYEGLLLSKCHVDGELSCLSCHSMHNAHPVNQLIFDTDSSIGRTNQNCTQCHSELAAESALVQHTHHAADSQGSNCLNCHMPYQAYGILRGVRSHRIQSPNATISAATGLPSACNLCHVDRSLGWTAVNLRDWFNHDAVELDEDRRRYSSVLADLFQGDALARALAAWHLGWDPAQAASEGDWPVPFLLEAMDDSYNVVRLMAYQSLQKRAPRVGAFDYLALRETRQAQLAAIRDSLQWSRRDDLESIPYAESGKEDLQVIRRWLADQDQTPISLAE